MRSGRLSSRNLPLSVRLVGRLPEEAGLEGVRRDGLYVALWRSGADAVRLEHGMRPPTPQAPGSSSRATTASRAATVGRCRETVHGWVATGSHGRSGQAATALPSLAQLSVLSHHCAQVTGPVGSDHDR